MCKIICQSSAAERSSVVGLIFLGRGGWDRWVSFCTRWPVLLPVTTGLQAIHVHHFGCEGTASAILHLVIKVMCVGLSFRLFVHHSVGWLSPYFRDFHDISPSLQVYVHVSLPWPMSPWQRTPQVVGSWGMSVTLWWHIRQWRCRTHTASRYAQRL